jgi:2-isopropylmalate synthase
MTCNSGSGTLPSAAVALWHREGRIVKDAAIGDGPIDAVFKTIERITGIEVTLRDFRIRSVTVGEDAQGEAHIEAEFAGKVVNGRAVSTDIIEASALAFLQVINRIALKQEIGARIHSTEAPPKDKEPAKVTVG